MIIRRLHKEDLLDAARIRSISFHGKLNEEEAAKGIEKTPEDRLYEHWGCFDEDGSMMACIINNDFTVRFDGQLVKMGGIGGVATLPEHQHRGYASLLMERVIADSRAQGRRGCVLTCKDRLVGFYERFGYVNLGVSASEHGGAVWYDMRLEF